MTHMEQLAVAPAPGDVRQSPTRTALAGLIGNVLEWFDFAVYGYFVGDIGRQFFPHSDATAQQLLAFAVFALGFCARPIGSLVLGRVGDRIGRRALLTLSIALMGGVDAGARPAADLRADRRRGADPAGDHAAHPGLLGRRRVHRLDGLHHRVGFAADARTGQQLHRGRASPSVSSSVPVRRGSSNTLLDPRRSRRGAGACRSSRSISFCVARLVPAPRHP